MARGGSGGGGQSGEDGRGVDVALTEEEGEQLLRDGMLLRAGRSGEGSRGQRIAGVRSEGGGHGGKSGWGRRKCAPRKEICLLERSGGSGRGWTEVLQDACQVESDAVCQRLFGFQCNRSLARRHV